jgi:hypothetical protein
MRALLGVLFLGSTLAYADPNGASPIIRERMPDGSTTLSVAGTCSANFDQRTAIGLSEVVKSETTGKDHKVLFRAPIPRDATNRNGQPICNYSCDDGGYPVDLRYQAAEAKSVFVCVRLE